MLLDVELWLGAEIRLLPTPFVCGIVVVVVVVGVGLEQNSFFPPLVDGRGISGGGCEPPLWWCLLPTLLTRWWEWWWEWGELVMEWSRFPDWWWWLLWWRICLELRSVRSRDVDEFSEMLPRMSLGWTRISWKSLSLSDSVYKLDQNSYKWWMDFNAFVRIVFLSV